MLKPFLKIIIVLVIFTQLLGCEKEDNIISDPIQITSAITNISEYGQNDGAIDLTVSGGELPFSFVWSNNKTTEDIDSIPAGKYYVVVSDNQHQLKTDTFEVTQPDPFPISISFETEIPSETGAADGIIHAIINGGFGPFTFSWSNGETSQDIFNLAAGMYILTVTDNANQSFTDSISLGDVLVDYDGNEYLTVRIGDQTWMKENLRVAHSPNGSPIECYIYRNDSNNLETNGRLYSWDAAMNGSTEEETQGICPNGWHIPSDEEIKIMEMALGMTRQEADQANLWRGATVGTQLKSGGSSGFDILLSGRRSGNGVYSYIDRVEYFWSSTESGNNYAWRRCIDLYKDNVGRYNSFAKSYGFSIRCVKDDN